MLCLLLVGAGEASRVAGGGRWCVGGRCRLPAALPAAGFWWVRGKRQCWGHLFFYSTLFFSTDGILEERGTLMAG
jgi:hypothetical protein